MDGAAYYMVIAVGTFISVALAVNGYFIKSLLESLNQVKIQTAQLIERSDSKEVRLKAVEEDIRILRDKIHEVEKKVD
jgi:hypothetical protein